MSIMKGPSLARLHTMPLLGLPLDAWFLVVDDLPPYDLLYLSHTCRILRGVAGRRLPENIRNLTRSLDRWSFITALADTSLDYWPCITCYQQHAVNLEDTPTNHVKYRCKGVLQYGYHDDGYATRFVYSGNYEAKLRHVQLSLKYNSGNRLDAPYRKHLEELMAPFHIRVEDLSFGPPWPLPTPATGPGHMVPVVDYQATPRILKQDINGSRTILKYIVHEEWRYRLPIFYRGATGMDTEQSFLHFGHRLLKSNDCCRDQNTEGAATSAVHTHMKGLSEKPLGQRISFSCRNCPTDYEMWFEELTVGLGRPELLVLHTWKYIRTSEDDLKRRLKWSYYPGDSLFVQDFTPGDARYLYENDGHLPPHTCVKVDESTPEGLQVGSSKQNLYENNPYLPQHTFVDVDEVTPEGSRVGSWWQKIWNAVRDVFGGRRWE